MLARIMCIRIARFRVDGRGAVTCWVVWRGVDIVGGVILVVGGVGVVDGLRWGWGEIVGFGEIS